MSDLDTTFASVARSMELYHRAEQVIPGATQLISRRPTRYAYGFSPAFAQSASGGTFTDVDGNTYIDWVSGIGAMILGYCDPVVDEAVKRQIDTGTMFSVSHPIELELAELLIDRVPCAEMVRFAKGGGDACAIAIRIARGTTGKDKVLFCGYHGWHDWYLAANLAGSDLDPHLFPGIDPTGVPLALKDTAIPFPYGDVETLEDLLRTNCDDIAAIIMEPLRSEIPPHGYLKRVRELATEFNVVLIFDEVSSGFRPTISGIQPLVNVEPDMAVFAKSISNGYPMGAVVGTRAVMQPASQMFISSTYWSDTLGIRAAITTLKEIERRKTPEVIQDTGRILKQKVAELLTKHSVPAVCGGVDWHPYIRFDIGHLTPLVNTLFIQEMAKRSIHMNLSFYINAAHGDEEVSRTIAAIDDVFLIIRNGLDAEVIPELVDTIPQTDSFRRLVT